MKRSNNKPSTYPFKLGDILIALLFLILSFIPTYIFLNHHVHGEKENTTVAYISHNNHLIKKIPLNKNNFTWTFKHAGEKNIVQVKNNKIRIIDANCKDQVCVKQGWKYKNGQTIICLPHKLLIEVKSINNSKNSSSYQPESKKDFDNTLVNP